MGMMQFLISSSIAEPKPIAIILTIISQWVNTLYPGLYPNADPISDQTSLAVGMGYPSYSWLVPTHSCQTQNCHQIWGDAQWKVWQPRYTDSSGRTPSTVTDGRSGSEQ